MRIRLLSTLLFLLVLGTVGALPNAFGQCATSPQLPLPFRAFDVQTGQEIQALCVGRQVRFELSAGRVVNTGIPTFFVVTPGTNATPPGCNFNVPGQPSSFYTPTAAGPVTVAENSNVGVSPNTISVVYLRNFTVFASPPPTFTLAACVNNTALVTVTDSNYDSYGLRVSGVATEISLTRGLAATVPAGTGSFTLIGRYNQAGPCEGSSTQTLAPLAAPVQPIFSRLTLTGTLPGPAMLEFSQLTAGYFYTLQIADGSAPGGYRDVQEVPAASTSVTLPSAPPGCYRLRRRDACATGEAFTPELCTIGLSAAPANGRNLLTFQSATTGATRYDLSRATGTGAAQVLRSFAGSLPPTYEDAEVVCGTSYTYRLTAVFADGRQSVSNPASLTTQSALAPPTPRLTASFDLRNRVNLMAVLPGNQPVPAGGQLVYRRSLGARAPLELGRVASTAVLRDSTRLDTLLAHPPCYSVRLIDQCGNASASESNSACPALLRAQPTPADQGQTVRLTWTTPSGPGAGQAPHYRLLLVDAAGAELRSTAVAGNSYFDQSPPAERQTLRYRLEVTGLGLSAPTFSNLALVVRPVRLVIPDAFTPNGDGLNDVLDIKGRFLHNFLFTIFDRNGQEVFRATDRSQTWDGRINGHPPVNGAYVWRLTMSDEASQTVQQTGTVTILK